MDFNAARQNDPRTRRSEPADWDRLRQLRLNEDLRRKPARAPVSPLFAAAFAILAIGIAGVIVLKLFAPAYLVHTVEVAQHTLSVATESLLRGSEAAKTQQSKSTKPRKTRPAKARLAGSSEETAMAGMRDSLPTVHPGTTIAEPLLIEVVDENGRRWFRGKDNKIRVTLKRLPFLQSPGKAPESAGTAAPATGEESFFLEVHYLDGTEQTRQDVVVLQGTITDSGTLANLAVLSGPPELGRQAIQVVQSWKLVPRLQGDEAVSTKTRIEVRFDKNDVYVTAEPIEGRQ